MSTRVRPELRFDTIDDVIDDIRRMRRVGYQKHGNWSLPQIAWHLGKILEPTLKVPTNRSATPEQSAKWNGFLAVIREPGGGSKFPAGPLNTPNENRSDADVEHFIDLLNQLNSFPDTLVDTTMLGAQTLESVQEAHRLHAAHHLAFLKPNAEQRTGLRYADVDSAIADIEQLGKGYIAVGAWTLPQICWHLNKTTLSRLQPPPFAPDTEEMRSRSSVLKEILASGKIPRIIAPPQLQPPVSAGEADVDELLSNLRRVKAHSGFSPHRLFGTMSDEDSRRHILIHAAHHLSFLVPSPEPH